MTEAMLWYQELWRENGTRARTASLGRSMSGWRRRRIGLVIGGSGAGTDFVIIWIIIAVDWIAHKNVTRRNTMEVCVNAILRLLGFLDDRSHLCKDSTMLLSYLTQKLKEPWMGHMHTEHRLLDAIFPSTQISTTPIEALRRKAPRQPSPYASRHSGTSPP